MSDSKIESPVDLSDEFDDPEDAVPLAAKRQKAAGGTADLEAAVHRTREHLEGLFAVERGMLEGTIATLHEELSSYRSRYWATRFELDDVLASRRGEPCSPETAEGEVQADKVLAGVEHLLAKARECDSACPERRFYYPTEPSQLPPGIREGMTPATFKRINAGVKEARRVQSRRKRGRAEQNDSEGEAQ